jgi:hypothetical protein
MFENDMFKTMIELNRTAFNNGYNAVVTVQEQSEKMMNTFLENNGFMPKEGQKVVDQWVGLYKKGQNEYKKMVDDSFDSFEGFLKEKTAAPPKKK